MADACERVALGDGRRIYGLTCILVLPAPLALVTGFIGLWDVERHPGRRGRARAWFGIAMAILAPATWFVVAQLATRY